MNPDVRGLSSLRHVFSSISFFLVTFCGVVVVKNYDTKSLCARSYDCSAQANWGNRLRLSYFVPTKGVGLRHISRHFETVSINWFQTSKLCCNCNKELSHVRIEQEENNKKLFRCLVCEERERSESKKTCIRPTGSELCAKHPSLGLRLDLRSNSPGCIFSECV